MSDTPKLSLEQGTAIRRAIIEAINEAIKQNRPHPSEDAVEALWIANRAVERLNALNSPFALARYHEAWQVYFAGWLQAKGITDPVKELGLSWSGFGGENQLKEEFKKWYDGYRP